MDKSLLSGGKRTAWNKGKLIGQKPPLKLKEIWAIRIRLQLNKQTRELALFNLAIDSKLRECDLVKLRVCDIAQGKRIASRAIVMQQKTHRPVQFEITEQTQEALAEWIEEAHLMHDHYLFPSRITSSPHLSTRQYARIVGAWIASIGLNPSTYGTHSMRRTKATLIYRRTKICEQSSFCWAIQNSKVPLDISALKPMMRWRYQSRLKYKYLSKRLT